MGLRGGFLFFPFSFHGFPLGFGWIFCAWGRYEMLVLFRKEGFVEIPKKEIAPKKRRRVAHITRCGPSGGYSSEEGPGNIFRHLRLIVLFGWWVLLVFFSGLWFWRVVSVVIYPHRLFLT